MTETADILFPIYGLLYIYKYFIYDPTVAYQFCGRSGGAMALGNLPVPGRPTIWMIVGQGPTVLAVGAGGGCLDIFTLSYPFIPLSPSLRETARYRLKYRLKGPLNPKQPTNLSILRMWVRVQVTAPFFISIITVRFQH